MDLQILTRPARSAGIAAALFLLAVTSLGQAPGEIESLAALVRTGSVEQKRDALYRLRVIGTEEAGKAALPSLKDPEPIVRATAAGSLAALPSSAAADALTPLLEDDEEFVRKEAVLALGASGDVSAEPALLRSLEKDDELAVRAAAAHAVGGIGTYRSLTALIRVLMEKPKEKLRYLRASAARSIGLIALRNQPLGSPSTTPESFLPLKYKTGIAGTKDLTSGEDDFTGDERDFGVAVATLGEVLKDAREASNTKREAAFALGAIGDRDAIRDLERCALSDDPYLAESCREALARLR